MTKRILVTVMALVFSMSAYAEKEGSKKGGKAATKALVGTVASVKGDDGKVTGYTLTTKKKQVLELPAQPEGSEIDYSAFDGKKVKVHAKTTGKKDELKITEVTKITEVKKKEGSKKGKKAKKEE